LSEIKVPQVNKVPGSPPPVHVDVHQPGRKSEVSDDEPLYDSVASDEDYIAAEQMAVLAQQAANTKLQENKSVIHEVGKNVAKFKTIVLNYWKVWHLLDNTQTYHFTNVQLTHFCTTAFEKLYYVCVWIHVYIHL
jgi:hypothetical protein